MLQTPMLIKEAVATEATIVAPTMTKTDVLEPRATSLRRAATALLFFGMLCARPCPMSSWGAWLAIVGSVAVLCASQKTILCRARVGRFLAFFAAYSVFTLVASFRGGMPLQIADKFHQQCMEVPEETFAYVQHKIVEQAFLNKGLTVYARHISDETTSPPTLQIVPEVNASSSSPPTMLVGALEPKDWTQPVACDTIARFVKGSAKTMIIGSTLAHLLLFLSSRKTGRSPSHA